VDLTDPRGTVFQAVRQLPEEAVGEQHLHGGVGQRQTHGDGEGAAEEGEERDGGRDQAGQQHQHAEVGRAAPQPQPHHRLAEGRLRLVLRRPLLAAPLRQRLPVAESLVRLLLRFPDDKRRGARRLGVDGEQLPAVDARRVRLEGGEGRRWRWVASQAQVQVLERVGPAAQHEWAALLVAREGAKVEAARHLEREARRPEDVARALDQHFVAHVRAHGAHLAAHGPAKRSQSATVCESRESPFITRSIRVVEHDVRRPHIERVRVYLVHIILFFPNQKLVLPMLKDSVALFIAAFIATISR